MTLDCDGTTSASLLERAKLQDREAWGVMIRLYGPLVYAWCRKANLSAADIDDVFQDVFATVAARLITFEKSSSSDTFRGWLRVVTVNKIRDHFRQAGKTPATFRTQDVAEWLDANQSSPVADEADHSNYEANVLYGQALALMQQKVEPNTWKAFWRTVVDGQPTGEVAQELDMSPASVRQAKSRVLRRLRDEFGDLLT